MTEKHWGGPRVAFLSDEPALRANVLATLAATLPGVVATASMPASEDERGSTTGADALVVDAGLDGERALSLVRMARSRGFIGGAVVLTEGDGSALAGRTADLGEVRLVPRADMRRALPLALLELLHRDASDTPDLVDDPSIDAVARELRRVQRLIVAGEAALRLPHALNNPLGALLAEAQLLQMQPLSDEHRESADRIVGLCRRMASIVRGFEEIVRA